MGGYDKDSVVDPDSDDCRPRLLASSHHGQAEACQHTASCKLVDCSRSKKTRSSPVAQESTGAMLREADAAANVVATHVVLLACSILFARVRYSWLANKDKVKAGLQKQGPSAS
jgi:hypothetical protein